MDNPTGAFRLLTFPATAAKPGVSQRVRSPKARPAGAASLSALHCKARPVVTCLSRCIRVSRFNLVQPAIILDKLASFYLQFYRHDIFVNIPSVSATLCKPPIPYPDLVPYATITSNRHIVSTNTAAGRCSSERCLTARDPRRVDIARLSRYKRRKSSSMYMTCYR